MVGHTGVFDAVVKAVETTDSCLEQVMEVARAQGYAVVVIADHGNADLARNADGSPHTAHTTNPVPIWVRDPSHDAVRDGILADVAPPDPRIDGHRAAEGNDRRLSDLNQFYSLNTVNWPRSSLPLSSALVKTHWYEPEATKLPLA